MGVLFKEENMAKMWINIADEYIRLLKVVQVITQLLRVDELLPKALEVAVDFANAAQRLGLTLHGNGGKCQLRRR